MRVEGEWVPEVVERLWLGGKAHRGAPVSGGSAYPERGSSARQLDAASTFHVCVVLLLWKPSVLMYASYTLISSIYRHVTVCVPHAGVRDV